jgi:hypothetical protein
LNDPQLNQHILNEHGVKAYQPVDSELPPEPAAQEQVFIHFRI